MSNFTVCCWGAIIWGLVQRWLVSTGHRETWNMREACLCLRTPPPTGLPLLLYQVSCGPRITLNIAGWEQWLLLPTVESTLEGGSSDLQPSQEQLHQGAKTFWERSHFPVATCFAFALLHLCKAILSSGLTEFLISSSDIPQKHESLEGFGVP